MTGCQKRDPVRQHVKRPDGFRSGDGDVVGQSVLAEEVNECETR